MKKFGYDDKNKQFNFPTVRDARKKKGDDPEVKKFYIANAEAIYSAHVRDNTGIQFSWRDEIDVRRLFSQGAQPEERYKNFFSPNDSSPKIGAISASGVDLGGGMAMEDGRDDVRQGWMHVFWDIISPAQKFMESLVGTLSKAGYRVSVDGVDKWSGALMENKKYEMIAIKESLEFSKEYHRNMGIEYQEPEFVPETMEELEIWKDRGGFKPDYAMRMEEISDHFLKSSSWDEVKKKMLRDALDLGVLTCMDYFCYDTNTYRTKYIDPKNVIIQNSEYNDYRDAEYSGLVEEMTAAQLRDEGVSEDDIISALKLYKGECENPDNFDYDNGVSTKVNDIGAYSYDSHKVNVLRGYFIDKDIEQHLKRKNRWGGSKIIEQEFGTENPPNHPKYETIVTETNMAYEFTWVIGTNIIFNYGPMYDQIRPEEHVTTLPIRVYRLDGESITKRLIPIYDQFMILWLKFMNAISQAINAGYAIDYDAISNMDMDGASSPQEAIVRRFVETGIIFFKKHSLSGDPNSSSGIPVHNLNGTLGTAFSEFQRGFTLNSALAEQITGFSPMAIGGSPDAETPVKTSEMALSATQASLRPILTGLMELKEQLIERMINGVQLKIKTSKACRDAYMEIIGRSGVRSILVASKKLVKYGFWLEARPTDYEVSKLLEQAEIARIGSKEGAPPIRPGDYFRVVNIITSTGNLKLAEMILDSSQRRVAKEAQNNAERNLMIQQKGAAELKQSEREAKLLEIKAKEQSEINIDNAKTKNKERLLLLEAKVKGTDDNMTKT